MMMFIMSVAIVQPRIRECAPGRHCTWPAHTWHRFGWFDRHGTIGYACCFPKAKDVACSRVIGSCVKHSLRNILHLVGCALVYLLQRCAFLHYNLHPLSKFAARLATYAANAPASDVLLAVCTDEKEMYTGMRHAESLDVIGAGGTA